MNQYRLALLLKEFPFLARLSEGGGSEVSHVSWVDILKIQRGDRALMRRVGAMDTYGWGGGGYQNYTLFFAVCYKGGEEEIVPLEYSIWERSSSGYEYESDTDPIGEQLFKLGINPSYIVQCVKEDHDANGNGRVDNRWTIYKMDDFDLVEHHKAEIDRAAAALKREIDAACGK